MTLLDSLSETIGDLAGTVGPNVVRIGRGARGAGVVVDSHHVVTNAHNLRGSETTVTLADGRSVTGTACGVDTDGDLAVLEVETGDAGVGWAEGPVRPGAAVFAVTHVGSDAPRVTFGLVSAAGRAFRGPRGRRIAGSIEHTAPLGRGSSGSPLVDAAGRLVGLNTHRLGDGFYLAIPADADLRARIDGLGRGETPARPTLGVALAPAQAARSMRQAVGLPDVDGLLVRAVQEDGPAAAAGLQVGDLLVEADGRPLTSHDDLLDALEGKAGQSLSLVVVRGAESRSVTVTLP